MVSAINRYDIIILSVTLSRPILNAGGNLTLSQPIISSTYCDMVLDMCLDRSAKVFDWRSFYGHRMVLHGCVLIPVTDSLMYVKLSVR